MTAGFQIKCYAQKSPYILAIIAEGMRIVKSYIFNVHHFTGKDTTIDGYHISKDTQVYVTYG
jgi:cytochrome P450